MICVWLYTECVIDGRRWYKSTALFFCSELWFWWWTTGLLSTTDDARWRWSTPEVGACNLRVTDTARWAVCEAVICCYRVTHPNGRNPLLTLFWQLRQLVGCWGSRQDGGTPKTEVNGRSFSPDGSSCRVICFVTILNNGYTEGEKGRLLDFSTVRMWIPGTPSVPSCEEHLLVVVQQVMHGDSAVYGGPGTENRSR